MKGILLALVLCLTVPTAKAVNFQFNFPNLEPATICYEVSESNKDNRLYNCVTTRFATLGEFEIRAGGVGSKLLGALSYDLMNLENHGFEVISVASDLSIVIGGYLGFDFNTNEPVYGWMGLCLQINPIFLD